MSTQQINSRLHEILSTIGISLSSLTDQTNFIKDLGLDSLDVTDLLLEVEIRFSIHIPDEDWWSLQTVGQLKEYLSNELVFDAG